MLHRLAPITSAFVILTAGCAASDGAEAEEDVGSDEEALKSGYVAASTFNKSGVSHSVKGSGVMVTRTRGGRPITTYDADHRPLGDVSVNQGPSDGKIRIQTLEDLDVGGKKLFRVWAGGSSNDGWIESDDVATEDKLREETSARAGNGESCSGKGVGFLSDASGPVSYLLRPAHIQGAAKGKLWKVYSARNDQWFKFSGDWDKLGGSPDRVALMWSWTRTDDDGLYKSFTGGGVIRTEMRTGESFTPCKVMPVKTVLREVDDDKGSKPRMGSARRLVVYAAYGKFATRSKAMYGWTILAERLEQTGACTMHVTCARQGCPSLPLPSSCKM